MNYLRGHKGGFPGKEKFKEIRRMNQVTRQKAARSSLLQGLRAFLTADSFMYGPLMDTPISPSTVHSNGSLDPLTPGREEEDGGLEDGWTGNDSENAEKSADQHEHGHEKRVEVINTRTTLSVQRTAKTVTPQPEEEFTPPRIVQVSTAVSKVELKKNVSLLLGDQEEGTSSMTSSYDDEGVAPLDKEIACQVVNMLVSKVGGRYSTELGIDVDKGDAEVERWFLAVTLFHRHLTFHVLKNTFEKLGEAGIVSVGDTLHMEEDEVADLLETAGYTTYKHRVAARLRKLAAQLEDKYKGKVSTMKDMDDAHELNRQIINLHGLSTNTGSIFLRELRGIWPGAVMDYERRTSRAATHLQIGDLEKSEDASNKSSISDSHTPLKPIAEGAGVDERDLEVALVKLGLTHERHYRECPGGVACNFLISPNEPVNDDDDEKSHSAGPSTPEDQYK